MKLLELPLEISQYILEKVVFSYDNVADNVKFRLVCKQFDRDILRAIFKIPPSPISTIGGSIIRRWGPRYIQSLTLANPASNNDLLSTISHTVNKLLQAEGEMGAQKSGPKRSSYTLALSTALVNYISYDHLDSYLYEPSKGDPGPRSRWDPRHLLTVAAYIGNTTLVKDMLKTTTGIDEGSCYFGTPLSAAASQGHNDITPLQAASARGRKDIVHFLLGPEYNVIKFGHGFRKALKLAAQGGDSPAMELLLEAGGVAWTSYPEPFRLDLLLYASGYGHVDVVRLILDSGTPVNSRNEEDILGNERETALHLAASRGRDNVVRFLLDRGACLTTRSLSGYSALDLAVKHGFLRVAQTLLDYGAKIKPHGWRLLSIAAMNNQPHVVRFLFKKGARLKRERAPELVLSCALAKGQEAVIRMLAHYGAGMNGTCEDNNPVLHAMMRGADHMVNLLVELGGRRVDPLKSKYAKGFLSGKYPLPPHLCLRKSWSAYTPAQQESGEISLLRS